MTLKYEIRIVKDDGEYIIQEEDESPEYINAMYNWYFHHSDFFNGSIQLWHGDKCLTKTNGGN